MKKRTLSLIKIYVLILGVGLFYALLFSEFNIKIPCLFNAVTGYLCPSCGISRMCIEILKGNFEKAYYYNRLIFILLPVFFIFFVKWSVDYIKIGKIRHSKAEKISLYIIIALLVAFGIVRNII